MTGGLEGMATGVHTGFEAPFPGGSCAVREGIDISGLPPGDYFFGAGNDDPTGGTEGMADPRTPGSSPASENSPRTIVALCG